MTDLAYIGSGALGTWFNYTVSNFSNNTTLNAPNEYDSFILSLPKSGIITEIGFYLMSTTYTGTSSGGVEIALKDLNTSGDPDTTNYGGSSGTVFTLDQLNTGWNWYTLSSPATGTVGDLVAAKVMTISADANNYINTANHYTESYNLPRRRALSSDFTAHPVFAIKYSDGEVVGRPLNAYLSYNIDNATDPDEVGAKIYPFAQMKVNGAIYPHRASTAPYTILLYDNGDNILTSKYIDDAEKAASSATPGVVIIHFSEVTLSTGTFYRLAIRPESASNVYVVGYDLITGTYRYCIPDGENWMLTYRTDAGAWTDEEDKIPYLGLSISEITGVGGGNGNGGTPSSSTGTANYYGWA